jgi:hypothetical protein
VKQIGRIFDIGRLFTLGSLLHITERAQNFRLLFSIGKSDVLILTKMLWAAFWAILSLNLLVTLVTV